jgi:hypothetical protein
MIQGFEVPSWKDEAAYPITKDTKPARWAWEFLRRNKSYQTDWQRYADAISKTVQPYPEAEKYAAWRLSHTEQSWRAFAGEFSNDSDRAEAGDNFAEIFRGSEFLHVLSEGIRYPLDRYLGQKWGLESIENPGTAEPWLLLGVRFKWRLGNGWFIPNVDFRDELEHAGSGSDLISGSREEYAVHRIKELGERLGRPELQTITFNLALPIDEQLKNVRAYLEDERAYRIEAKEFSAAPQPRYEARMYRNYLRAFDAKQAGAKHAEIVKVLLPKEAKKNGAADGYKVSAKVKAWIKQAELLVDTGYRFLPLAANKAQKSARKKKRG